MKQIILFDPSYGTMNTGDEIINKAIMHEMSPLFRKTFLTRYSTHTPIAHAIQLIIPPNFIVKTCIEANYKFIGGTNIFKRNLLHPRWDWNINLLTMSLYKNSIVIGGGLEGSSNKINSYSTFIYKRILSKEYIHSVRDEKTYDFLSSLGVKVLNTGCPTLWSLTKTHCSKIPKDKAKTAVFTLTDYRKNPLMDQRLIDLLNKNYSKLYFWPQGIGDYNYLRTLSNIDKIEILSPSLIEYRKILESKSIDYIGTRLHAGIFAMQHKIRAIILSIDNRARDMHKSYNINAIERDDIDNLEKVIKSRITTDVKINESIIGMWKDQFNEF